MFHHRSQRKSIAPLQVSSVGPLENKLLNNVLKLFTGLLASGHTDHKIFKRAVRILISANYKAHTEPFFSELKIMSLPKLFQYSIMFFMYKFTYNMLPSLFFHYE